MTWNRKKSEEICRKHRAHLDWVKAERLYYHDKIGKAVRSPDKFLSIILDGTDQTAYGMPHFSNVSHISGQGGHKLKVHLVGVLVHGRGTYCYTILDKFEHGSSLTVECLQRTFKRIEEEEGSLPETLFLQLDNCWRENKNQFLLGYLTWLVDRGIFKDVEISFLPKGHTHEDIDQVLQIT